MTYSCTWPDGTTEPVTLLELSGLTAKIERQCGQAQYVDVDWLRTPEGLLPACVGEQCGFSYSRYFIRRLYNAHTILPVA